MAIVQKSAKNRRFALPQRRVVLLIGFASTLVWPMVASGSAAATLNGVAVSRQSATSAGPSSPEVLGSGLQAGGPTGFFTIFATGTGNTATGNFSSYQNHWPTPSSAKFKLRTATVTCVTYGSDNEATITGTVTSGSNSETVVAQAQGGDTLRFSYAPTITQTSPGCDTPSLTPVPITSGDIETGPPFSLSTGEVLASGVQQPGGKSGLFAIDTEGAGNTATGNFTFYQSKWPTSSTPNTLRQATVGCVNVSGSTAMITGKVTTGSSSETVVAEAVAGTEGLRFSFKGAITKVSKGCDEALLGTVPIESGDIEIGS